MKEKNEQEEKIKDYQLIDNSIEEELMIVSNLIYMYNQDVVMPIEYELYRNDWFWINFQDYLNLRCIEWVLVFVSLNEFVEFEVHQVKNDHILLKVAYSLLMSFLDNPILKSIINIKYRYKRKSMLKWSNFFKWRSYMITFWELWWKKSRFIFIKEWRWMKRLYLWKR